MTHDPHHPSDEAPAGASASSGPRRRAVGRVVEGFLRTPVWVAAVLQLACTIILTYGVVARYISKGSITYLNEFTVLLACWMAFLGAAEGIRTHYHVTINLLVSRFPRRAQAATDVVVSLVMTVGLGLLAVLGYIYMAESTARLQALEIPRRPLIASMPVGFTFMAIYTAMHAWQAARGFVRGDYTMPVHVFEDDADEDVAQIATVPPRGVP